MKLTKQTSLQQIKELAANSNRLVYGFNTCWWKIGDPIYSRNGVLPCGPRGEMLLETSDPVGFIAKAEENPEHYGPNGLDNFVAAYHGNITTDDGKPTSFESWAEYNKIVTANKAQLL